MQLDLLYSFLLSAWTDTRRFRLQIHRYTCVCVFIQHEGKGSDWRYMATRGGGAEAWATTQSLSPPLPWVTLFK